MINTIFYFLFRKLYPRFHIRLFKEDNNKVVEIFKANNALLFLESRKYPSLINNGYRHIEVVINLIKKNKLDKLTILDIGGAAGDVALLFSDSLPLSTIHSFEPIAKSFSDLKNKTSKISNINSHNFALGSRRETIRINVAERITSSSLYEINEEITDSFFSKNLKLKRLEEINVRVLDEEFKENVEISLIKLDVQGYELEVLRGAVENLKNTHFILTEVMNHDFYKNAPSYSEIDLFLRENNFVLFDILPSIRRDDKLMEWDVIYKNANLN
ncbi:MAG TPA: FkbM family methyltransferase [Pelobium sp.]|nr:FkbM family methyltransferase [Pelobium sp.]